MTIIGIVGKKQSGKDTIFEFIRDIYKIRNVRVARIAFADALKQEVCAAFSITPQIIEKNKDNFRMLMQAWGTEVRRKLWGENYWVDKVLNKINHCDDDIVVIPDCRFLNEAAAIKYIGGYIVRIIRPVDSNDTHPSETELEKISEDYTIINDSSLESLRQQTITLTKQLDKILI